MLLDLHTLASCDYVVCTFSSNVCRLVYEMMQIDEVDSTWKVASLDSDYFVHGEKRFEFAVEEHKPENNKEIELMIGDMVEVISSAKEMSSIKFYNQMGFKKGYNHRTKLYGFYPAIKTIE
jgi:glycoprotein 6-alpha-L-fucosyltransferase